MKIRKIMKSIACCGLTIGLLAADIPLSYIALDNISLTKTTVLAAEELTYYDVGAYYNYYVDNNAVYITSVMVSDSIITVPSTIDGKLTPAGAAEYFVFSKEADAMNRDNTQFIYMLYRTFMGRECESNESLNVWLTYLNQYTRQDLFEQFAGSNEFKDIVASYGL